MKVIIDSKDQKLDRPQDEDLSVNNKRKISFDEIKQEISNGIALGTKVQMILNEPENYFISKERVETYLSRKKKK